MFISACSPTVIEEPTSAGVSSGGGAGVGGAGVGGAGVGGAGVGGAGVGGAGGGSSCVASDEVCDGLDNDCDGDIDEDNPGGGDACESGELGVCGQGTVSCEGGALVCQPAALPSVELCDTAADESCDGKGGCDGMHLWSKRFGGQGSEFVTGIAATAEGGVLVAGHFDEMIDFGLGGLVSQHGMDAFLAKLDADGLALWSRSFPGYHDQYMTGVAADAVGNAIVTGWFSGGIDFGNGSLGAVYQDIFLAKLDPGGATLWSKRFGKISYPCGVAVDAAGNILIGGDYANVLDFGDGPLSSEYEDVFVAKLDPDGNLLWGKHFGGSSDEYMNGIAVDGAGNIVVAGEFESTDLDFGNGPLTNAGNRNIWVAKLDPDGKALWSKAFGDVVHLQRALSVAVDPNGNVVLTGEFKGTVDFGTGPLTASYRDAFVVKLDQDGQTVWARRFASQNLNSTVGRRVAVDAAGNVLVTGVFADSVDFGAGPLTNDPSFHTPFVVKFDAAGKTIWSKSFGGHSDENDVQAVAVDEKGNVLVAETGSGVVDLGGGPLFSVSENDVFVAKLAP